MMRTPPLLRLYELLSPLLAAGAGPAGAFSPKMREALAGRRGLMERLRSAGPDLRGCIWFHAASVGEYEQARPMIARLRERGDGPIAVTHYSPSGVDYAEGHAAGDFHDFLPLDRPADMAALVEAWQPRALVCVKYDCWPNQLLASRRGGVPCLLLAAALPPGSRRITGPGRAFFRQVYGLLDAVGTGHPADRDRFRSLLGDEAPVVVTGDTRAEQVIARFDASAEGPLATSLTGWGARRLVLGSTWPPDEALWLPVLPDLLSRHPDLNVVLVPHEPRPDRLAALEADLAARDVSSRRLSAWNATGRSDPGCRCLLVDEVGVLAEIYHAATLAYVGGSFTTGVHSTLEPAVAGVPVLFGPRIDNAEEALAMTAANAGRILRSPADALAAARNLLADDSARRAAGRLARGIVTAQRGATDRNLALLDRILADYSA